MKLFIKDGYDKVEYAPVKLRAYADLLRPFPVLIGFAVGIIGGAIPPLYYGHPIDWVRCIYISATFSLLVAASNALNQFTDVEEDLISKPWRPVPRGLVTEQEALTIGFLLYTAGIARGFLISPLFGLIAMTMALFVILYSFEPVRLKKRLLINNLSLAVPRGLLAPIAIWSAYPYADMGDPLPYLFGLAMLGYLTGAVATKDFKDMAGDAKRGNRTLPLVIGKRAATLVITLFLFSPYILFWLVAELQPLLYTFPVVLLIALLIDSAANRRMEYDKAYIASYIGFGIFYIGWALIYI